jgi:glycine cleavage system aminomethyltransferase T
VDRPVGRVVYTPVLGPDGGFRSDLTVVRLDESHFRVVTGGSDGARDLAWFTRHLPADGSVALADITSAVCTLGLWGPRARDVLAAVTEDDVSDAAFPFGTARWLTLGSTPVLALRLSYVGELGWELHTATEHGLRLWDTVAAAGAPHGLVPAGIGVYGTTARIEKGYRLMGHELDAEHGPVEAGLALPGLKKQDFVGKAAYTKAREAEPEAVLCTLRMDGTTRFPQGGEPVLTADGGRITDRRGRPSYVTSAGSAPSLGTYLLLAYLPPGHAVEGAELLVEYLGERYPVTVARAGRTPLFDPDDARMRG